MSTPFDYFEKFLDAGIEYKKAETPAPIYMAGAQDQQRDIAGVSRQTQADPSSANGLIDGTITPFLSTKTGKAVAIGGGLIAGLAALKLLKVI